ncbi:hypothetical protein RFI_03079, partial [Reticulomyxa filosa]
TKKKKKKKKKKEEKNEKEKMEGKTEIDIILYLASRTEKDCVTTDRSEVVAKELVRHCFYELHDKGTLKEMTLKEIINRSKKLYEEYGLGLCFLTFWEQVEVKVKRDVQMKWGVKPSYEWIDGRDEDSKMDFSSPPLKKFIKDMTEFHKKKPKKKKNWQQKQKEEEEESTGKANKKKPKK